MVPVQTRRLTDQVAALLRARIESSEFRPGERLPTADTLAEAFKVSRTVIREATAHLRADGIVETRQGAGTFVAASSLGRPFRIDPDSLTAPRAVLELYQLRMGVEVEAAALAARLRTTTQMAKISRAMAGMESALRKGDDAIGEDLSFHAAIATATGNELYLLLTGFLGHHYRASILRSREGLGDRLMPVLKQVLAEHHAIHQAVLRKDEAGARKAMRRHLSDGHTRILNVDEPPLATAPPVRKPRGRAQT